MDRVITSNQFVQLVVRIGEIKAGIQKEYVRGTDIATGIFSMAEQIAEAEPRTTHITRGYQGAGDIDTLVYQLGVIEEHVEKLESFILNLGEKND